MSELKLMIYCNAGENGAIECPLSELSGSPKGRLVEARGVEPLSENT